MSAGKKLGEETSGRELRIQLRERLDGEGEEVSRPSDVGPSESAGLREQSASAEQRMRSLARASVHVRKSEETRSRGGSRRRVGQACAARPRKATTGVRYAEHGPAKEYQGLTKRTKPAHGRCWGCGKRGKRLCRFPPFPQPRGKRRAAWPPHTPLPTAPTGPAATRS
jgi:hypothetical protein